MPKKIQFDDDPIVQINITPLVDIVLVLLVIFMVTAQFIVGKGIKLELPTAQTGENLSKNNVVISITKDSKYIVNNKKMTVSEVKKYIDQNFQNKSTLSITINADKSVSYHSLVTLMDALRLIGISNFALQTETSPTKFNP